MLVRILLISTLVLSLADCAGTRAPAEGTPGIERLTPEELARMLPKPIPKLPLAEIVRMSKTGVAAQDIIAKIKQSGSHYALSPSRAIELHSQGVSTEVLDYMQSAREQELRDRNADEINQREQRRAEELRQQEQFWRDRYYYDPWWPAYPGHGHPFQPFGGFYWRR